MSTTNARQFSYPFMDGLGFGEDGVLRRRALARVVTYAAMFAIFGLALGYIEACLFLLAGARDYLNSSLTAHTFFVAAAVSVTLLLGPPISRRLAENGWDADLYQWLDLSKCKELADLCDAYPALSCYRDQVCNLGRRFTSGKFFAMKQWASSAPEHQAQADDCRRLYKIT